ncbi:Glycogenin-1 [Toxocara canis]|uniref:glycogenin glucosyltransferase n=1 Tax=Toxocara canis TaxID=6265 RepID=A0A0B2VHB6_TOXCA|nr:Glycogenin-1 [Toxocara canis]
MTEAWVTLATTDGYAVGALVLAQSLKASMTTKKLHCMVTTAVSQPLLEELRAVYDAVTTVNVFDSGDSVNLGLIGRPDLGVTFTKIHCWRLTQYTKCVFLDADCLVLQNSDELFERPEFSAAADIGWPDCFNSGVFVFVPSEYTYGEILRFALEHGSFDGGDQGLLNMFYSDWRDKPPQYRLPFIYNMTSGAIYTYAAAYKRFGAQVKIVHFLGVVKPWQESGGHHISEHLAYWWSLFSTRVAPNLPSSHVSSWSCSMPLCTLPSSSSRSVRDLEVGLSFSSSCPLVVEEVVHLGKHGLVDCVPNAPAASEAPSAVEAPDDATDVEVNADTAVQDVDEKPPEKAVSERNEGVSAVKDEDEKPPPENAVLESNEGNVFCVKDGDEKLQSEEVIVQGKDDEEVEQQQSSKESISEGRTPVARGSSLPPNITGRPNGSCMRVFRCIPPVYQTWTPLRFLPKHLANQMAAFSPGSISLTASGALITSTMVPGAQTDEESGPTDEERMKAWEIGHPDYLGRDAFANIQKAIDEALHH